MKTTLVLELSDDDLRALTYLWDLRNQQSVDMNIRMMRDPAKTPINTDSARQTLTHIVNSGVGEARRAFASDVHGFRKQLDFIEGKNK